MSASECSRIDIEKGSGLDPSQANDFIKKEVSSLAARCRHNGICARTRPSVHIM